MGQYTRCGKHAGYLEDTTIENKDSITETFATAVLHGRCIRGPICDRRDARPPRPLLHGSI